MMVVKLNQKGSLVIVFIILAAVIVSGIFVAINLPNSLPGDITYPIKGIYENLRLAANELSYEGRAEVFASLSNNRLEELEKLIARREYSRIDQTLDRMILMQRKALDSIGQAQYRPTDLTAYFSKLEVSLNKQQSTLKKLYFEIPSEQYDTIDKAVESTQENLNRLEITKNRR